MNDQPNELTIADAIAHWNEYDDQRDREKDGDPPAHDAGPTTAECAAADRQWPLQKEGE
ncbi:hypothetical protein [Streptomyces sp. NPDC094149]|uniref:hypothetical protein n=1 Tax=Streptomyces sp. NPDC094149 TaxID=3155079 RepID=UPI00332896EB